MFEVKILPFGCPFVVEDMTIDEVCKLVETMNEVIKKHGYLSAQDIEQLFDAKAFEDPHATYVRLDGHTFNVYEHPWNMLKPVKMYWIRYSNIVYKPYKLKKN